MKVAVTSTGNHMDSEMDPRFGRCPWFIIVNTDDMQYESVANANADLSNGAGIQAAGMMASLSVEQVITGNCGPKASQAFAASGIRVNTGYSGTVRQAVDAFKQAGSGIKADDQSGYRSTAEPEWFLQSGAGMGGGRGMAGGGRGMGGCNRAMGGGGRGMGGCGRGQGMPGQDANAVVRTSFGKSMNSAGAPEPVQEEDLASLKSRAENLKKALREIEQKIDKIK